LAGLLQYEDVGEEVVGMLDGMFSFVLVDLRDKSFIAARDPIGITPLYLGWGNDGAVYFASEMKALKDDCERFEIFPPGHIYSSKSGGLRRYFNPPWYSESIIPYTPYDPAVLRVAFEKVIDLHPCFFLLVDSLESVSICVCLHPCYLEFVTSFKNKNLFMKFMDRV
jgi:asparagine synthetase B (glutamine-hydrolysing)